MRIGRIDRLFLLQHLAAGHAKSRVKGFCYWMTAHLTRLSRFYECRGHDSHCCITSIASDTSEESLPPTSKESAHSLMQEMRLKKVFFVFFSMSLTLPGKIERGHASAPTQQAPELSVYSSSPKRQVNFSCSRPSPLPLHLIRLNQMWFSSINRHEAPLPFVHSSLRMFQNS